MRFLFTLLTCLFVNDRCQAQNTPTMQETTNAVGSLTEVVKQVNEGDAILLDVRSKREWTSGHLTKAKHVPVKTVTKWSSLKEAAKVISKDKPLFVHCAKGVRAANAAAHLNELGFKAHALEMDYEEIRDAGFTEVEGSDGAY